MTNPSGRALLLSAYDAYSHRQWHTTVTAMFPDIEWTRLTLPPRHFRWRLRGNSLSWAFKHHAQLTDNHDFLLCTSMTDLSALRGFVPELARLPTAVYFHENQFAYPERSEPLDGVEPRILNLYTALCADELIFNSHYNHRSFLDGVTALLRKLPDAVPEGLVKKLEQASIIPVPLPDALYARKPDDRDAGRPLTLVWNHRWEYDKGPGRLLSLVRRLVDARLPFRLHLVGQQFRQQPPAFGTLTRLLDGHYRDHGLEPGWCGFIEDRNSTWTCWGSRTSCCRRPTMISRACPCWRVRSAAARHWPRPASCIRSIWQPSVSTGATGPSTPKRTRRPTGYWTGTGGAVRGNRFPTPDSRISAPVICNRCTGNCWNA